MTPLNYFKRFRMELDLRLPLPRPDPLPDGYWWLPWDDNLIPRHAEAKFLAFQDEIDTALFPSLASQEGCCRLMEAIRKRSGFVPGATWLIMAGIDSCGTVQGVRERCGAGAIQNLGVAPAHRGRGLATILMLQALHGFRMAGITQVILEVTAQNEPAVRLYRRLGFRARKTLYKTASHPAPVAEAAAWR